MASLQAPVGPSGMIEGYPKELFGEYLEDKYLCNFCGKLLREPVQSFCGHRFCKNCIESQTGSGQLLQCIQCQNEMQEQNEDLEANSILDTNRMFPDNAIKREMARMKVKCIHKGCTWEGTFKNYELTHTTCEFQPFQCPKCEQVFQYGDKKNHEDNVCQKRKVQCTLCYQEMLALELESHQRTCKGKIINCQVCCDEIEDRNLMEHFQKPNHFYWILHAIETVSKEINQINQRTGHIHEEFDGRVQTKIRELEDKLTMLQQAALKVRSHSSGGSPTVSDASTDIKIQQMVERQTLILNEGLDIKIRTFESIASTLHRELSKTITTIEKLEHQRRDMQETIDQNVAKIRTLERTLALKDITLAEMELKVQTMDTATFDGHLIWKVTDFSKKQIAAAQGHTVSIYSPPFYSSRYGYKMCARIYPNGDGMGKGSHLSVFFVVMRGNYDALQKWPFEHRVSFCLLNQTGSENIVDSFKPDAQSSSFQRPVTDMNIASGCPLFIRLEVLRNATSGFVKDDTLFLKIAIESNEILDTAQNVDFKGKP